MTATCENCNQEIKVETWIDGSCPLCNCDYRWKEIPCIDEDGYDENVAILCFDNRFLVND